MTSNQIGTLLMGGYPPMALPPEGVKFGLGALTVVSPQASGTQVPAGSFGWDGVGSRRFWSIPSQDHHDRDDRSADWAERRAVSPRRRKRRDQCVGPGELIGRATD